MNEYYQLMTFIGGIVALFIGMTLTTYINIASIILGVFIGTGIANYNVVIGEEKNKDYINFTIFYVFMCSLIGWFMGIFIFDQIKF